MSYTYIWFGTENRITDRSKPTLYIGQRADRVLLGPDGQELKRLSDRPFRGYRSESD